METWPAPTRSGGALRRLSYITSRKPAVPVALRGDSGVQRGVLGLRKKTPEPTVDSGVANDDSPSPVDPLRDIATAANAGDQRAVRTLVLRMRVATAQIVRNVLGHTHPALDDVIQEATIAQVRSLKNFRGESTVAHFVNSVTLRVALSTRRRINARRQLLESAALELWPDVDPETPLSIALDKCRREAIRRILRELPPKLADVLILHTVVGYSSAELARMRQVTESTIRSQLRVAKKEFRRLMRRERRTGAIA
jgi:RNA polymerase sigma-70 factor (ECF subfamily)